MSYCKFLGRAYGGKWVYAYPCYWVCDDDKRYIARVSAGTDEYDNSYGPGTLWLYGEGEPQRAKLQTTNLRLPNVGLS